MSQTTQTFHIVEIIDINRRKSGSVSFIRARVSTCEGDVVVSTSGRLTDDAEHVLAVDASSLTVGGKHLASVDASIAKAKADRVLTTTPEGLPPIVAVSEKQAAYAETLRRRKIPLIEKALKVAVERGIVVDILDGIRNEIHANADARFWIDVPAGGVDPGYALSEIARFMIAQGRDPRVAR